MPTGYTSKLYEGEPQTFAEFALTCARAFGALVEMRDSSLGATIPDQFEPSTYHVEKLALAEIRLREIDDMSDDLCDQAALRTWQDAHAAWEQARAEKVARRERYEAMLREVEAWVPPSEDHDGMKKFMAEQLTGSIEFDCSVEFEWPEPKVQTGDEWRRAEVAKAIKDIDYHTREHAQEVERTEARNRWLHELWESLPDA